MQRTTSKLLAAGVVLASAAGLGSFMPDPLASNTTTASAASTRASQPAMPTPRQAAAQERAAWLSRGASTWRPPGYPRPGDSVRQHARKAARRRAQVRARRALRG